MRASALSIAALFAIAGDRGRAVWRRGAGCLRAAGSARSLAAAEQSGGGGRSGKAAATPCRTRCCGGATRDYCGAWKRGKWHSLVIIVCQLVCARLRGEKRRSPECCLGRVLCVSPRRLGCCDASGSWGRRGGGGEGAAGGQGAHARAEQAPPPAALQAFADSRVHLSLGGGGDREQERLP